ncbi:hypothetical protein [Streptomyces qinzhouensis]|uniref:Uncharacterized protein n=1 Tax=Streptomyces qinzhouensis TaxID=2599401 RepID=A0A5B8J6G5_9ACTN|nr:hypothetical protein [Streptomyces qinzhouensis]QDY77395.1 hypothetical protein FQU76_13650 [Streptomyces qinzhouensis]
MTHSGHGQGDRPDGSAARGDSWIPDTPAPGQPWGDPWGPQAEATMNLAPVPPEAPGADDATRYIPPVPPAEMDATAYLPPVPPQGAPPQGPVEVTAYLPHLPPEGPAREGFESFFREDRAPESARARAEREDREEARQKRSQFAVMGAVIVGCAVLGLGLSAAIYGTDDAPPAVAAAPGTSAPARTGAVSPPPKPSPEGDGQGRAQAAALDKLLADSNNSRDAVVRSVANIRRCEELGRAATDLRGAAEQRRTLVARLQSLGVDRLPRGTELSAALIKAWRSSAAADDHYASWAEQVQGERGCRDGRARTTRRAVEGNRASAEATTAKRRAAAMWNAIAEDHELTERRAEQL